MPHVDCMRTAAGKCCIHGRIYDKGEQGSHAIQRLCAMPHTHIIMYAPRVRDAMLVCRYHAWLNETVGDK